MLFDGRTPGGLRAEASFDGDLMAMAENDDFATKREAYYVSKNWGHCRFDNQAESDATMDDVEALASVRVA